MPLSMKKLLIPLLASDRNKSLENVITYRESYTIATAFYEYWNTRFPPTIFNFMKLVNEVGWFASYLNKPVQYRNSFCITRQDYMVKESISVLVFDRKRKKRKKITLAVPSTNRVRAKSMRATFANFRHQTDASIACHVVMSLISTYTPIYTVHDNFLTNAMFARKLPTYYTRAFIDLLNPLFCYLTE